MTVCKVVLLVLVIHYSNVQEERVFSLITKNKTDLWPNLKLDGTLSSIVQVKLANPESCNQYEPEENNLKTAKSATMEYTSSIHKKITNYPTPTIIISNQ